ncbi:MAG: histidine kinase [Rikenellaceae bacterium]
MKLNLPDKEGLGENLLYILLWSSVFFAPLLNAAMISREHLFFQEVLVAWYKIIPYFLIFLVHNYKAGPRVIKYRNFARYLLASAAISLVTFIIVDYLNRNIAITMPSIDPFGDEVRVKATISELTIFWNVTLSVLMIVANMGIKLMYQSMRDEQEMEQLKRHNLQVEMEYLKYQINPHFFMNTLNNIHALIDIDADSAKSAVIDLSKMMRYVLYDSGSESISLENDLKFIDNYIELMRIRYSSTIDIKVERPDELPKRVSIPPLLLIVFIENAFKHGLGSGVRSFIHMNLEFEGDRMNVLITNNIAKRRSASEGGIGLINVRKRMDLIYGENYSLETSARDGIYSVKLNLPTTYA